VSTLPGCVRGVAEHLACGGKPEPSSGIDQGAAGESDEHQSLIDARHRTGDRIGDVSVGGGEVVQGAVRLDVTDAHPFVGRDRDEVADLIGDDPLDLGGRERHHTPSESAPVGEGRMTTERQAAIAGEAHE
jgi:hypothetical protein